MAFPFGTPEPSPVPTEVASESTTTTTKPATPTQCDDSKDNDGDRKIDLADPGCSSRADKSESNAVATTRPTTRPVVPTTTTVPPTTTQPPTTAPPATTTEPPGTTSPPETQPPTTSRKVLGECSDGIDNDNDGKIDLDDKASCHGNPADDE